jgi:hypothetical protein
LTEGEKVIVSDEYQHSISLFLETEGYPGLHMVQGAFLNSSTVFFPSESVDAIP